MLITMNSIDQTIQAFDMALRTLGGAAIAARPCPTATTSAPSTELTDAQRRLSGALMRVNHVGEVCAQALYQAQALSTRNPALREQLAQAAREETDHLAWTAQRLAELGSRPSLLNPLWYAGAFAMGLVAGRMGDAHSLGFVAETERQVEQHLASHLERFPVDDAPSRVIVEQMKLEERQHADNAVHAGAAELPLPVRLAMRAAAKVMTTTAHHL